MGAAGRSRFELRLSGTNKTMVPGTDSENAGQLCRSQRTCQNVGDASILLANLGQSVVPPTATVASTAATTASVTAAVVAIAPVAKTSAAIVLPQTGQAEISKPKQDGDTRRFQNTDLSPVSSSAANQELDDVFADTDWNADSIAVSLNEAFESTKDDPLEVAFAGLDG